MAAPWEKYQAASQAPWEKYKASAPVEDKPSTSAAQSALEGFGQGVSANYLPQIQAASEKVTDPIFSMLTGQKVEPEPYVQSRDENIARIQKEELEHPKASMAGRIGGSVAQAAIAPGAAPESLLGSIGKGALTGAGFGLIQNPGDVKGEVNPIQAKEHLENAVSGAKTGAIAGPLSYGVSKVLGGLAKAPESLEETANEGAIRQTGAMLKDFRQLEGKNETQKFGQFLRDKGLVKAGDTFEDVADKASALQKDAGSRLDTLYKDAGVAQKSHFDELSNNFKELPKKEIEEYAKTGFSIARDKDELIDLAKSAVKDQEGGPRAVSRLSRYLNNLESEYGGEILPPKKAQEIKSAIDKTINYSRNPLQKQPELEQAFSEARKSISSKIDDHIDYLAKKMGSQGSKALKEANKDYGYAKKAADMASDYVNRQGANRAFSLTDTIAGGAGGIAAEGALAATGDHNPAHMGEAAIGGALVGGALHHYGKNYGGGLISGAASALSPAMRYSVSPVAGAINSALPRAGIERGLLEERLRKK